MSVVSRTLIDFRVRLFLFMKGDFDMRIPPSQHQIQDARLLMNQLQNRITPRVDALEAHKEHLNDCIEQGDAGDIDRAVELIQGQLRDVYQEVLVAQGIAMSTRVYEV